jgi:hypothetical protein
MGKSDSFVRRSTRHDVLPLVIPVLGFRPEQQL